MKIVVKKYISILLAIIVLLSMIMSVNFAASNVTNAENVFFMSEIMFDSSGDKIINEVL